MAKIEELVKNQEFVGEFEKCSSLDEMKDLYARYDVEEYDNVETNAESEEISEEEMKNVTGGLAFTTALIVIGALGLSGAEIGWLVQEGRDAFKGLTYSELKRLVRKGKQELIDYINSHK